MEKRSGKEFTEMLKLFHKNHIFVGSEISVIKGNHVICNLNLAG